MAEIQAAKVTIPVVTNADQATASFGRLDRSLNNIESSSKETSKSMIGLKTGLLAVGAVGATALYGMAKSALKNAAALEQNQIALTTMLGSTERANKLLQEMREMGASTPFETKDLIDASKKMIAFGYSAENVKEELRKIGDLAAGVGQPIGDLATIFGKAKLSVKLYAEDLNQLHDRGIPAAKELGKVLGVSATQVKKLASEGKVSFKDLQKALENMTKKGGQFGGMMEKQAKSLTGLWSTLKSQFTETSTEVGQKLAPAFKDLLETLTSSKVLLPAIKALFMGIGTVINGFVTAVNWVIRSIESLGKSLAAVDREAEIKNVQATIVHLQKLISVSGRASEVGQSYAAALKQQKINLLELSIQQAKYNIELAKTNNKKIGKELKESASGVLSYKKALFETEKMGVSYYGSTKTLTKELEKHKKSILVQGAALKANNKIISTSEAELKRLTAEYNKLNSTGAKLPVVKADFSQVNNGSKKARKSLAKLKEDLERMALTALSGAGNMQAELKLLEMKYKKEVELVSKAGMETNDLTKAYMQQREDIMDKHRNKELNKWKEQASKIAETISTWSNAATSAFTGIGAAIDAYNQAAINALETRMQAELKAAGVAEKTTVEQAQREYDIAIATGNALEVEEKRRALVKAQIEEKYLKEKAQMEYDAAMTAWGFQVAAAAASGALAVVNAVGSGFRDGGIYGAIAFGAIAAVSAGASIAAVAAAKPQPPTAQFGGSFVVPPGNQADSGLLRVNSGEKVDVSPVSQSQGQSSNKQILRIGERDFEGYLVDAMNKIANSGNFNITRQGVVKVI